MPAGYYNKTGLPIRLEKIPWNKGLTKEVDERVKINTERATNTIREQYKNGREGTRLGSKATEQSKQKMRISHTGYIMPESQKEAIGDANRGKKKPPRTEIHKLRLSLNHAHLSGKNHPMYGRKGKDNPNWGRKLTKEQIKKCLTKRIPSSLEEKFQQIIDKYQLPYKYVGNGSFVIKNCNPDFINTNNQKIAVEVYAKYYKLRNYVGVEQWKEERSKIFAKYGWKVIFFDETQVNENNILKTLCKIDLPV